GAAATASGGPGHSSNGTSGNGAGGGNSLGPAALASAGMNYATFASSAITLVYGQAFETLELLTTSPDIANVWVMGLTRLMADRNRGRQSPLYCHLQGGSLREQWLLAKFREADVQKRGLLLESEMTDLSKSLCRQVSFSRIKQNLREMDATADRLYDADTFLRFFKELTTRPELYFLLSSYASDQDFLTPDELLLFLEAEQNVSPQSLNNYR
ncbi:Inactive phospholipase C-like protein 2, partial [Cichlidogyrus casuarinus]